MRAGKLDRLIDLQEKTVTQSGSGEPIDTWSTLSYRRPSTAPRPLRAEERFTGPQIVATDQVEFRIRYSESVAGLSPKNRLIYPAMNDPDTEVDKNRIYDIIAVNELGRREGLQIIAQRRPDV